MSETFMKKTKLIAMYLPQYHETEDNNRWWGEGFTDWVSVKGAEPLYEGHRQPRIPLEGNYYDLTNIEDMKWQIDLAREYGVHGFGIYHYWFSTDKQTLTKPAELLLEHTELDIPFFLAWDNNSWIRTWSRFQHNTNAWSPKVDADMKPYAGDDGILAKLEYGTEEDWEAHFLYLEKFFRDPRYIRVDNKPLFIIWNYTQKDKLKAMICCWRRLAIRDGFDGICLINRLNPYDSMSGFDYLFTYEPMFSAWQNLNIVTRVWQKIEARVSRKEKLKVYDYDKVWGSILANANKCKDKKIMFGAFVDYDDTPRRGNGGRIVKGGTPDKFEKYLRELIDISEKQGKEYIFLTAWNEWGEGAYLEPDTGHGYAYLEAVLRIMSGKDNL